MERSKEVMDPVLIDLDDVLCDWRGEALRRASRRIGREIVLKPDHWFVQDIFPVVEKYFGEKAGIALLEEVEKPHFHRCLPPIPGGKEALEEMLDLGHDPYIVTWPWEDHDWCASEKLAWVRQNLGRGWERRTMITSQKALVHGSVLVDDKPNAATATKHKPKWRHVLFEGSPVAVHHLNPEHPAHLRLRDWSNWRAVIAPLLLR